MKKILILGAKGLVGGQLKKLRPDAIALDRGDLDATDEKKLRSKL